VFLIFRALRQLWRKQLVQLLRELLWFSDLSTRPTMSTQSSWIFNICQRKEQFGRIMDRWEALKLSNQAASTVLPLASIPGHEKKPQSRALGRMLQHCPNQVQKNLKFTVINISYIRYL